jgi:hypothetical protein
MPQIKIEKLGEIPKVPKVQKTRSFPKSILKKPGKLTLKGVRDPAKTKHTLRLLTTKGHRRRDKTMKQKIGGLTDDKVRELTTKSGLVKNPDVPKHLQREILEHAVSAGFVSI